MPGLLGNVTGWPTIVAMLTGGSRLASPVTSRLVGACEMPGMSEIE